MPIALFFGLWLVGVLTYQILFGLPLNLITNLLQIQLPLWSFGAIGLVCFAWLVDDPPRPPRS